MITELKKQFKIGLPRLILTDIDGVWTDGGMYYADNGVEFKKFNTYDSAGVLFCKRLDIPMGIITGEDSVIVRNRAKKLKIDKVYCGVENKLMAVEQICLELNIKLREVAYIGDDINDFTLIKNVGFSACPQSAVQLIKDNVSIVLRKNGGEGVFREFIEYILAQNQISVTSLIDI